MKYIIRHQFRELQCEGNIFYVTDLFKKLKEKLINIYPQHEFIVQNDQSYETYGQGSIYSCMSFSIINPTNDNYILISLFDNWKYHFMKHLGWNPKKMKQFFYAGGFNYFDYFNFKNKSKNNLDIEFPDDIQNVYNTFFYNPYYNCCYDFMKKIYETRKVKYNKLFFRGWLWDFRKHMINGISQDDILILDKNQNNQNLKYEEYLQEMSEYECCLSLPGGTEVCNRDIECFYIGTPVIRPYLQINYPEPLIPNYHYINCYHYCDYTYDGHPNYISYDDFKNNLLYMWDSVKNNKDYLNFIAKNANDWATKNCTAEKNIELFLQKINLDNLN
jgi:hypothetical protein